MKNISNEFVSRRLGAAILAASLLALAVLPLNAVYAAGVSAVIPVPLGLEPDGLVVSPLGDQTLYVASTTPFPFNSNLIVINTQFNTITALHPLFIFPSAVHSRGSIQILENAAENLIFVDNYLTDTIDVINEATNTQIFTITPANVGPNPVGIAITPDGKQLWVCNSGNGQNNGTVQVIDSTPGSPTFGHAIHLINTGGSPNTIVFNSTGTLAYVLNDGVGGAGFVDLVRVSNFDIIKNNIGAQNGNILNFPNPLAMAITSTDSTLYIADAFSDVVNVDIPRGTTDGSIFMFKFVIPPPANQVLGQVLVSPSQRTVVSAATADDSVRVASTGTQRAGQPIFLPGGSVPYFMAFSPNGTLYVSNFNNALVPPFGGLNSISVVTGIP
jgi:DNA-binding beta-propeller fold protein YncE